ncbi:MAG: stage 0 sporulation family protein [Deltaproteobacteria bacterium]|nr:stage 0 sporulation family protein [Deltaproteobacteria bacterium]
MAKIVTICFKNSNKKYNFDPGDLDLKVGDRVIVETDKGLTCGTLSGGIQQVSSDYLKKPLKKVIRVVGEKDLERLEENHQLEQKARKICLDRVAARRLQMKLVEVEYLFDRSKVIFYFTADGRIDFRELVRDLASQLRVRIEMRQIGVRDEARMLGGVGPCGKEFCCRSYLQEFEPVSIKMAKHQNLSINPAKISGVCGRLLCCLSYENSFYHGFKKGLPKPGKMIMTAGGPVKVRTHNVLQGSITVMGREGKKVDLVEPDLSHLRKGLPLERDLFAGEEKKTAPFAPVPAESGPKEVADNGTKPKPNAKSKPRSRFKPRAGQSKPRKAAPSEGESDGLLNKLKKMTGIQKDEEEGRKKRRPRRRRRRRPRGKASSTSGGESKN